jgi:hypothetical protein
MELHATPVSAHLDPGALFEPLSFHTKLLFDPILLCLSHTPQQELQSPFLSHCPWKSLEVHWKEVCGSFKAQLNYFIIVGRRPPIPLQGSE